MRREGMGMLIRLAGVVVTLRIIGPGPYGIYSAALAFVSVVAVFAQMGLEVYLIRQPGELTATDYNRAYTLLACVSVAATLACLGATFVVGPWLKPDGVLLPLRVMLLSIPINVLWAPGQASIERRFGYRHMGWLEVGGDLILYFVAVPLAVLHFGAWALVVGYIAWQCYLLVGSIVLSGLRPRWDWSRPAMAAFIRHGTSYSAFNVLNRMTGVVNALVVGTFAGAVGVGYVSFALRLVDVVGFAARGAYRLGLVAMSKVADTDRRRLRYAIEEGSILQLVALGIPFACFGVVAPWLVPALFGQEWAAALPTYSVLAVVATCNAPSLMFGTLLFSRGENLRASLSVAIATVILAASAVPLVAHFGAVGYAWASLLALADTWYLDRVVRRYTAFSYRMIAPFAFALSLPICFPLFPLPWAGLTLLPLGLLVVVPSLRAETWRIASVLRSTLNRAAL